MVAGNEIAAAAAAVGEVRGFSVAGAIRTARGVFAVFFVDVPLPVGVREASEEL